MNEDISLIICMTSDNRIDCARINQEIIKQNYSRPMPIVHASSNAEYKGYLEDAFVHCEKKPLHQGAVNLLQQALKKATKNFAASYIVHLEADTWLLDERVIYEQIARMERAGALLSTSAWSGPHPAPSFLARGISRLLRSVSRVNKLFASVLREKLRNKLLPIVDFSTQFFIIQNNRQLIECILRMEPDQTMIAEKQFFNSFTSKFSLSKVVRMTEREPVHPDNRYRCKALSLYCQHWPAKGTAMDPRPKDHPLYVSNEYIGKKETLQCFPHISRGEHLQKLLAATNYDYYNPGAIRY